MKTFLSILLLISSLSFLYYGLASLFFQPMKREFERYQLSRYRTLTGNFQILGGLGLLLGFYSKPLLITSSCGLSVMMLLAIGVRRKIGDPLLSQVPAILFFIVNLYILISAVFPAI